MAQQGNKSEMSAKASLLSQLPAAFADATEKRFKELANAQSELFERVQEMNREWLVRMQAETNLASEFASKLSSARSIPDAMTAWQEWGARRFEMMAEDTKYVLDDTQKFMQTGAHMLANGFASKGPGLTTWAPGQPIRRRRSRPLCQPWDRLVDEPADDAGRRHVVVILSPIIGNEGLRFVPTERT